MVTINTTTTTTPPNLINLRSSEISKLSRISLSSSRRAPFDPLILEAVISIAGQNQTRNHSLHQFSPRQPHHPHHHHHQLAPSQHLDLSKPSPVDPLANLRSALQARLSYLSPTSFTTSSSTSAFSVTSSARTRIPTPAGQLWLYVYENSLDDKEHLAIVADPASLFLSKSLNTIRHPNETDLDRLIRGASVPPPSLPNSKPIPLTPLVRIHSECFTGETIGSTRCDCGDQLSRSISRILSHPSGGAIIYLRQEGRGIGLSNKLKAYNLQDLGFDTLEANLLLGFGADQRDYRVAASILDDLGLTQIALVTNNPSKVLALQTSGKVRVIERVDIGPLGSFEGDEELEKYLKTKVLKMGHLIDLPGLMRLKS